MAELVFLIVCVAGAFLLAMRRAPLWGWALALAAALVVWQSGMLYGEAGALEPGFLGIIGWLLVGVLAALSIPVVRRATLVAPLFNGLLAVALILPCCHV
jgi:hypothetical protein